MKLRDGCRVSGVGCRGVGCCRLQSSRRGFTLLELLVVIGVIALLAAIIMPVVGRVQERGREVRCTSNLRQLHTAAMSYASAHGQNLFPRAADSVRYEEGETEGDGGNAARGWVAHYPNAEGHAWWFEHAGYQGTWSVTNGTLFQYVGDAGDEAVYVCPTMVRYARRTFSGEQRTVVRSYGMNPEAANRDISRMSGQSRTFLFADQGLINMGNTGGQRTFLNDWGNRNNFATGAIPPAGAPYWENRQYYHMRRNTVVDGAIDYNLAGNRREWIGAYHGRRANQQGANGGRANVVFVDGHVESVSYLHTDFIARGDWQAGAPIE